MKKFNDEQVIVAIKENFRNTPATGEFVEEFIKSFCAGTTAQKEAVFIKIVIPNNRDERGYDNFDEGEWEYMGRVYKSSSMMSSFKCAHDVGQLTEGVIVRDDGKRMFPVRRCSEIF